MKTIAVTQRVSTVPAYGERRDCLDQQWTKFLLTCELLPTLLPNVIEAAQALCQGAAGLILTGGNDLAAVGGDAPERDLFESALLDWAERSEVPVLGVCRGMQMIQQRFGVPLQRVEGHVTARQLIRIEGEPKEVDSYFRFAAFNSLPPLEMWAVAADGVVKAIRHSNRPIIGIMWHPERCRPFSSADVMIFQQFFGVQ